MPGWLGFVVDLLVLFIFLVGFVYLVVFEFLVGLVWMVLIVGRLCFKGLYNFIVGVVMLWLLFVEFVLCLVGWCCVAFVVGYFVCFVCYYCVGLG